jgi:hypothetical protein
VFAGPVVIAVTAPLEPFGPFGPVRTAPDRTAASAVDGGPTTIRSEPTRRRGLRHRGSRRRHRRPPARRPTDGSPWALLLVLATVGVNFVAWGLIGAVRYVDERRRPRDGRGPPGAVRPADVAVLIAAHNEEAVILDALRSVRGIVPRGNVYVASDGSTDATSELVRSVGVHVLDVRPNRGKAGALRAALEHFRMLDRYEAVLFVDADTRLDPGYLRAALPWFDDAEVVAVAGYAKPIWEPGARSLAARLIAAHRHRLYAITQMLQKYGQTWRLSNVAWSTTPTGSCSASAWRTTCASRSATGTRSTGPAATSSARAPSTGRGSTPAGRPDGGGAAEDGRRVRVLHQARRALLLLPRRRHGPPEGTPSPSPPHNLDAMVDAGRGAHGRTGVKLLWGTANLFSHPRYAAGAATNPDPEVFAYAAAQVKHALEATHRLGGENYVLWGGREGYETLLNTDLRRRRAARPVPHLVAEHKHAIGFEGTLLIEPKPQEPTKHQYDYDCATVHGFLDRHDLAGEYKVNIEVNHATLAGHSFHHEVAYAIDHGIFGSVDANRGDPQNGWDTDQFPNSVEELALALYEILRGGGFTTGGFNFDTKLRRQSLDRDDLFHGHIGGIDTLAQALLVAADRRAAGPTGRSAPRRRPPGPRRGRACHAAAPPSRAGRRRRPP